ncbi:MAG: TonB C-terminal domain-containing protein, partial [Candidatus Methylomirabilis sp.]|nr:TonB C-terminal domain-containing protein [Deltaproteobacteria bacterium]
LVEQGIESSSGNPIMDEAALRAVIRAAPFPPLPFGLGEDFVEIGIRFHTGALQREDG